MYVGKHQTEDLNDSYLGSGKLLGRALKKHGVESFRKEILHVFETESEMNSKEAELVSEEFCSRGDTYNICPGGKGGWGYVNKITSAEQRKKQGLNGGLFRLSREERSEAGKKGGAVTAELLRGKPGINTGLRFSHSEEAKAKISAARKRQFEERKLLNHK